jgi:hypothetical protein
MPDADLVELAQRYVSLTAQLESVRNQMRKALANGADLLPARPTKPPVSGGRTTKPHKSKSRAAVRAKRPESRPKPSSRDEVMARAVLADEAVMTLVRSRPGVRTGEIARSTQAKSTTTVERLRRLKDKGLITGGRNEGWTAASPS